MTIHTYFAPAPLGLEELAAEEIRALGARKVHASRAGVSFSGPLAVGYRVCLWSRTASRVLMRLAEVPADSPEELYEHVIALPWEDHMAADASLAVDFTGSRSPITHTHYGALKVKDAIVDRFRSRTGVRPDVDVVAPALLVNVAARSRSAVISIDLSGDALHRRGYRTPGKQTVAPLKETLAASVLLFAEWPGIAAGGGSLVDPACGSGTLLIEGACIAGDRAPGLLRSRWGFDRWLGHDSAAWDDLLDEADTRAEEGASAIPPIVGLDIDPAAVELATACVTRAGLASAIRIERGDFAGSLPQQSAITQVAMGAPGLLAVNPPYGHRLGEADDLGVLYESLANFTRQTFPGWRLATITADEALVDRISLPFRKSHPVYNGRIPSRVSLFDSPRKPVFSAAAVGAGGGGAAGEGVAERDPAFANRLRKNIKRLRGWAKAEGVTCYRLYDADMPEYSVSVDRYEGAGPDAGRTWAYVCEYAPPRDIDPLAAQRRLAEAVAAIPEVMGVSADDVHVKVRQRQRGASQYEKLAARGEFHTVAEGGLLFEVNLTDYLDTGLFLDHRLTRAMLRDSAAGKRFLNLFAYTGSATVYAAAGGAASTCNVDMSQTYIDWAGRNMARNGFTGPEHTSVRADILAWVGTSDAEKAGPFDLIFCDPPAFSTSKRMESTFDVQRDHGALLAAVSRLLAPGGVIVFSNNLRRFKLDAAALTSAGLTAHEITAETMPADFGRNRRIHNTWRITHG